MNYIKTYSLFIISYLTLILASTTINSFFDITPEVGLNIVALVVTTLLVIRLKYINFLDARTQVFISLFGGGLSVITTYILASIFDSFMKPSITEGVVIFIFNSIVTYITIYFSLKKNDK